MSTARENAEAALAEFNGTPNELPAKAQAAYGCVDALRDLLADAAPTEDVREALSRALQSADRPEHIGLVGRKYWHMADAILARFRVTPKEEQ